MDKNLYVIRLDDAVLNKPKYSGLNPNHRPGKPCMYVGSTALDPDARFKQHLNGHKPARIVKNHGMYLMRRKYEHLNPVAADEAEDLEKLPAERLRRKGYWVWQN